MILNREQIETLAITGETFETATGLMDDELLAIIRMEETRDDTR